MLWHRIAIKHPPNLARCDHSYVLDTATCKHMVLVTFFYKENHSHWIILHSSSNEDHSPRHTYTKWHRSDAYPILNHAHHDHRNTLAADPSLHDIFYGQPIPQVEAKLCNMLALVVLHIFYQMYGSNHTENVFSGVKLPNRMLKEKIFTFGVILKNDRNKKYLNLVFLGALLPEKRFRGDYSRTSGKS